jgi:hypothetical protein
MSSGFWATLCTHTNTHTHTHTVVQNMWHECTRKRNGWLRLGLSQVPICRRIYFVGLCGLPLFFQVILWPREWEFLLNLQEGIDDRRKGSRDSHLYPETSPISVRGTSNAGPFRTSLKEPTCLPSNNRERNSAWAFGHLLASMLHFLRRFSTKKFLFQIMVLWMLTPCCVDSEVPGEYNASIFRTPQLVSEIRKLQTISWSARAVSL